MSNKLMRRLAADGALGKTGSSSQLWMSCNDDYDSTYHFYVTAVDVEVMDGKIVSVGSPRRYDDKEDVCTAPVLCKLYPWRKIFFPQSWVEEDEEDSSAEIAEEAMRAPLALLGNVSGRFLLLFGEQDIPMPMFPRDGGRYCMTQYHLRQIRCSGIQKSRNKRSALHIAGLT